MHALEHILLVLLVNFDPSAVVQYIKLEPFPCHARQYFLDEDDTVPQKVTSVINLS
jgi:hypothetical protein